jgi:hypothetical protein
MREVLVIITKKNGPLNPEMAELQRQIPEQKMEVLDFTLAEPNYEEALEKIFSADSVQVW